MQEQKEPSKKVIPLDKMKEYRKTIAENARKKKDSVKALKAAEGKKALNLSFLPELLKSLRLTQKAFAEKAGITEQAVRWWLSVDDVKLSSLLDAFEKNGYRLSYEIVPISERKDIEINGINDYVIEGVPVRTQKKGGQVVSEMMQEISKDGHLLTPLVRSIYNKHLTPDDFRELTGMSYFRLYYILSQDNIKLSEINLYARASFQKIVWKISKK